MGGIALIIFDNDGVVVDSELLANRVLAELLSEAGHPTTVEDSIRDYLGGTLAGVHGIVKQRSGCDLPHGFDDAYHARLFAAFATDLRPVPGIADVLEGVASGLGVPFCLASSGTRDRIRRSLTVTGLLGRFEGRIFSAEDVAHGKPAPDLFLHVASTLAVDPARCVVVEDSPNGVSAARAAGMTALGYAALTPADRLAGAAATFSTMDGLLPLLAELDAAPPAGGS